MIYLEIIAGVAALLWCVATFLVWYRQDINIFPGNGAIFGEHAEVTALGGKALSAERDGYQVRWYWFEAAPSKAVLVLFHGNSDGAFERLDFAQQLLPAGISVALVEYPGYGGEPVPTSEWPLLRNSLAAYDEVAARAGSLPVFVMGESLGTGPATYLCTLRRPRALLLSTPYTSMASVAKHRYPYMPIHALIRHPIKAMLWAPQVRCPVLVLHGTRDKTVPYAMGQSEAGLFRNVERFVTIEGAGHSNIREAQGGEFWKACLAFISGHC